MAHGRHKKYTEKNWSTICIELKKISLKKEHKLVKKKTIWCVCVCVYIKEGIKVEKLKRWMLVKVKDLGVIVKEQKAVEINAGLDSVAIRLLPIWLKN